MSSCSNCHGSVGIPVFPVPRPVVPAPCIQLTRCNLTRQQINGLVNKLNSLKTNPSVPTVFINKYLGLAGSALNAKNFCIYYQEIQEALDFVAPY